MLAGCTAISANGSAGYHNKLYNALNIEASPIRNLTVEFAIGGLSANATAVAGQIFGRHELQVVELSVLLPARKQFLVRAIFDYAPVRDYDDPVCAAHGGQAMRYHKRRAVCDQMVERFLHGSFGRRIQRRG